jgi:hypothetical protein
MNIFSRKNKKQDSDENKNVDIMNFISNIPVFKNIPIEKIKAIAKEHGLTKTLDDILKIWNNTSLQNFINNSSNIKVLKDGSTAERLKLITKFSLSNPVLTYKIAMILKNYKKLIELLDIADNEKQDGPSEGEGYNGSPQALQAPQAPEAPQAYSGPPKRYIGPGKRYNGSSKAYNRPIPYGYVGPPYVYAGPPYIYAGPPPYAYNGPSYGYNGSSEDYEGPSEDYAGPPEGYDRASEEYEQSTKGYSQPPGPPEASNENNDTKKSGKSFDIDANLNRALYYLIIFIIYVMLGVVVAVAILTIYNYVIFSYNTIYEFLLSSDETNAERLFIRDTYSFNLINYVFCQGTAVELRHCDSSSVGAYIEYLVNFVVPLDNCDSESKVYIYGLNRFFNFCMKLFYLVFIIIFVQLLAYIIIYSFLGGMRNYEIKGQNMFSYLSTHGALYVYIMLVIFVYCLVHAIHFKVTFNDNVYDRIWQKYEEFRRLDNYVNSEAITIKDHRPFLNLLKSSTVHNIGKDATTSNHKNKIIDEIKDADNNQVQSTKLFLYTLYTYVVEHNKNGTEDSDIEIIKKLNTVVFQKPEDEKNLNKEDKKIFEGTEKDDEKGAIKHIMREFFKLNIDMDIMKTDINNVVISIGKGIADYKNSVTPTPQLPNQFIEFNFETALTDADKSTVKYNLANKLSSFYSKLETSASQNFDDVIYYMNMYIVLEWFINAIFILLILLVVYYNADQSPWIKRIVVAVQTFILSIIQELQTAIIGI